MGVGFLAGDEPGPHSDGCCAGGQQLSDPLRGSDPACRDDRDIEVPERLCQQLIEGLSPANVTARLNTLCHDEITARASSTSRSTSPAEEGFGIIPKPPASDTAAASAGVPIGPPSEAS